MKKIIFIYLFLIVTKESFAQAQKDTMFFNNGSMVIGEIKKIKLGVITFDPDNANDITVQLRNLKTLSGVTSVFRIETVGHDVYYGKLMPGVEKNYAQLVSGMDTAVLFLQNISKMYPFGHSFIQRFSGNVGLGYSYT